MIISENPDGTLVVSRKVYEQLKTDSEFLNRLYACGVDNWEGYSEAFDDEDDEE